MKAPASAPCRQCCQEGLQGAACLRYSLFAGGVGCARQSVNISIQNQSRRLLQIALRELHADLSH